MTRGTVLIIARDSRELALFQKRLEKERYAVTVVAPSPHALSWMKAHIAQAVICDEHCSPRLVEQVSRAMRRHRTYRFTPLLLLGRDDVPQPLKDVPRTGFVLRLHKITVAEALRRLQLAMQLGQLARSLDAPVGAVR